MKLFLSLIILLLVISCQKNTLTNEAWENQESFQGPESIFYDANSGFIFVSNVNGNPDEKNGKGYIARLDSNGKTKDEKWIKGLNAPKGLRTDGNTLWVADIDQVVKINIDEGKIEKTIACEGAMLLNDLTVASDGSVYVSDTFASKIFHIENDKASVFMQGEQLDSPNGLFIKDNTLYVASWGLTTDWSTKTPGRVYQIDLATKEIKYITPQVVGNLDGIEMTDKGNFLVSDWVAGKIFEIFPNGNIKTLFTGEKGLADIGFIQETKQILIPYMIKNKVFTINYK